MIDIILCAYNSSDTIEQCVSSILNQTYKNFNLFIFDDCSTDDTVKKIKSFHDDRITVVSSKKNIGTYAAKNFVLKNLCKSQYVALHDSDDFSEPERLQKQLGFMVLSGALCVGTAVNEFWDDHKPHTISENKDSIGSRKNTYPKIIETSDLKSLLTSLAPEGSYEDYLKFKFCMNGTVLFNRDILQTLGGWDGNTRIAADTDIFIRILGLSKIYNISEALYNRRFHSKSLTASRNVGINSEERKNYNLARKPVVENSLAGKPTVRDFYYPDFKYKIIKCAE
jgi:glycosyltransferase involved in cell wall biosynthesis